MNGAPDAARATLPSDAFAWCIAEVHRAPRAGAATPAMLEQLHSVTPAPPDTLHAVATTLGPRTALVCAIDVRRLNDTQADIEFLGPAHLPPFARDVIPTGWSESDVCARLNLLVGRFEPARPRRLRARRTLLRCAAALMLAALLGAGMERRRAAVEKEAMSLAAARELLLAPHEGDALALLRERDSLRSLHSAHAASPPSACAAATLAALLTEMPEPPAGSRLERITAEAQQVTLDVRAQADDRSFFDALNALHGWHAEPPRASGSRSGVRSVIRLARRHEQPQPPSDAPELAHRDRGSP